MNLFNWVDKLVGYFTLNFGGGGGGGPQTSTGTTYTSNLPEYAKPFFEQALVSAGKNVFETLVVDKTTDLELSKFVEETNIKGPKFSNYTSEKLEQFVSRIYELRKN